MSEAPLDCYLAIPCFRESERLPRFLTELASAIAGSRFSVRVRVVDDGSGADELAALQAAAAELREAYPFIEDVLALPENRGKGGAIRAGWAARPGACRFLGFIDADGAVRPSGFLKLLERATSSPEDGLVVGSRRARGGAVRRHVSRRLLSLGFYWLTRLSYGISVSDTQCGCKLVPRGWYAGVERQLQEDGFGLDIELLLRARRDGMPVDEVAVDWEEQPDSKVGASDVFRLGKDVLLRRIGRRG